MSLRAYARHRAERGLPGGSLRAVQKALEAGRIQRDAAGLIDSELADAQWEANSSEGHRRGPAAREEPAAARTTPPPSPAAPPRSQPAPARRHVEPPGVEPSPSEGARPGMSLAEASALEKVWRARLAELEYEERAGRLVPAEAVEAKWVELVTLSKTRLLALPSKIKQRLPTLTAADVALIDGLVREALEELAVVGERDEEAAA